MARVKYGQGVADIRGSVGGTVFSRNANGAYMRNRTTPFNSNTIPQQLVRAQFGTISRDWRNLTQEQQDSFVEQAPNYPYTNSLGEASVYTGFQLFQKVNTQLAVIGVTGLTIMPAPVALDAINSLTVTDTTVANIDIDLLFSTLSSAVPANTYAVLQATRPLSFGVNKPKRPDFKEINVFAPAVSLNNVSIAAAYNAVFGNILSAGDYIFIRLQLVSGLTAQTSAAVDVSVVLT